MGPKEALINRPGHVLALVEKTRVLTREGGDI